MWSKRFWQAAAERAVRAGAASVLGSLLVADGVFNVLDVNSLKDGGALFLGGALVSGLISLAGGAWGGGNGPSLLDTERLSRP